MPKLTAFRGNLGIARTKTNRALLRRDCLLDRASHHLAMTEGRYRLYPVAVEREYSLIFGAFILGVAGVLKRRRATTHWAFTELLPLVGATHEKSRVVKDGNVITAGGVNVGNRFRFPRCRRDRR